MACNNYINLYIFKKYFPDKLISPKLEKVNTVFFIISILFCVAILIIIIVGSLEEFNDENIHNLTGKIVLLIFVLILINWVYVLFMQIKMCNVIKRGNYRSLTNIIDSIGKE